MSVQLDHRFLCAAPLAPEAEPFPPFGLREAHSDRHPGHGTRNRRFLFQKRHDRVALGTTPEKHTGEPARRTLLWERWSGRQAGASPCGIGLRPAGREPRDPPFPAWEYRPRYLPEPLVMHIAETAVEEPMWVYRNFMRRLDREHRFVEHPNGIRGITGASADECRAARFDRSSENDQPRHPLEFSGRQSVPRKLSLTANGGANRGFQSKSAVQVSMVMAVVLVTSF
jgi:hypothetical protein